MLLALAASSILALAPVDTVHTQAAPETVYIIREVVERRVNPAAMADTSGERISETAKLIVGLTVLAGGVALFIHGMNNRVQEIKVEDGVPRLKRESINAEAGIGIALSLGGVLIIAVK